MFPRPTVALLAIAGILGASRVLAQESPLEPLLPAGSMSGFQVAPEPPVRPGTKEAPVPVLDTAAMHRTIARLSSKRMGGRAPLSKGSKRARRYIIARMKAFGLQPAGENGTFLQPVRKALFGNQIGTNVVGRLPGRKSPEECVYVDAHYDHWGHAEGKLQPGANDNASGVAVMLEIARVLSMIGTDRTVVFLASDFEEGAAFPMAGGLKGTAYHLNDPHCATDRIKAALVMDMVGGSFIPAMKPRLFLLGNESDSATYALAGNAAKVKNEKAPALRLGVYAIEPAGASFPRGDYGPFRDHGVPFIFATSGIPPEYHTPEDTIDKIDFAFMAESGKMLAGLVRRMASTGFEPKSEKAPNTNLFLQEDFAAYEAFVKEIEALPKLTAAQSPYVAKLRRDRLQLREYLPHYPPDLRAIAIRRTVANGVGAIMRMNGSLRMWQHINRNH